jgi:hypothetical protein
MSKNFNQQLAQLCSGSADRRASIADHIQPELHTNVSQ